MKEHFQDSGVRKWAGDDLIELQSESLEALQGLVEPYAPCIIKGCEVATVPGVDGAEPTYKVSGGLVALRGVDAAGNGCVKIARVEGFTSEVMPVYLSLANKQTVRAYGDGSSKVIANDYIAECSAIASEGALELTADGGKRLVDKLGVTQKLDQDGGEAKDTMVGFTEATTRTELTTGSKLGILFGLVKKWFSDLRALAFKDKVAKGDLTDELVGELDGKVAQVPGKDLSTNDFTDALKDKLNTFDHAAGGDLAGSFPSPTIRSSVNLTGSPTATTPAVSDSSARIATTAHVHSYAAPAVHNHGELTGFSDTRNVKETPDSYNGGFYVKGIKTYSACGLTRLQAGNFDYVQVFGYRGWSDASGGYAHEFALTNNGAICHRVGQSTTWSVWEPLAHMSNLKWTSITGKPTTFTPGTHNHPWGEITGKPTTFTPDTHNHPWGEITGKPTTFTPSYHTHAPGDVGAPKIIAMAKVSSTGGVTNLYGTVTCAKSGTGLYIIRDVTQSNILIVNKYYAGLVMQEYLSNSGCQLAFYNSSGTKTDSGFTVMILGL